MLKNNLTFHTAIYSLSSFLVAIAGLITFPIITRVMSVEEYGVLNLVSLTLMILIALGKAGLQRSIVRFGSEARSGTKAFSRADVYLTGLAGMLLAIVGLQLVWAIASQLLPLSLVGDPRVYWIFIVSSLMVIGQVVYSGLSNVFVSEKESVVLSVVDVASRYGWIAFVVPGLLLVQDKLTVFYLLTGVHEIVFCLILLYLCHRYFAMFSGRISMPLARQMLAYGAPLVGYELLTHVFAYGDRVQINYFLGTAEVGYYSAAYNLCIYVKTIFVASLVTAVTPMYMDRWESEGRAETESFLALVLRYYLLLAIPAAVGITIVGEDMIAFLAGEKYAEAHGVIPYVIIGMLVDGITAITAAGLQIEKRTKLMMAVMGGAAVFNLGLNLVLIPRLGIEGAALATLLSYLAFTGTCWYLGRRILTIRFDLRPVIVYSLAAALMSLAVLAVDMPGAGLRLFARVGVGAAVFSLAVLSMDSDLRRLVATYARPAWNLLRHRFV